MVISEAFIANISFQPAYECHSPSTQSTQIKTYPAITAADYTNTKAQNDTTLGNPDVWATRPMSREIERRGNSASEGAVFSDTARTQTENTSHRTLAESYRTFTNSAIELQFTIVMHLQNAMLNRLSAAVESTVVLRSSYHAQASTSHLFGEEWA